MDRGKIHCFSLIMLRISLLIHLGIFSFFLFLFSLLIRLFTLFPLFALTLKEYKYECSLTLLFNENQIILFLFTCIRAIEEIKIFKARVLSCSQYSNNPSDNRVSPRSLFQSSCSYQKSPSLSEHLAAGKRFFSNLISGRQPHHQDCHPQIYPSKETPTLNSNPRIGTRVLFVWRLPPRDTTWLARGPSSGRRTSPADSSSADQPF